jgi:hypothetical protein
MSVQLGLPPADIFWFSPNQPQKIARSFSASPDTLSTFLRPVSISPTTFESTLSFQFALTFAIGYVTAVFFLNKLNASRQHKPWAFSKTSVFKILVVTHNTFLASFSAWMFYGICYSIYVSWPMGAAKEGSNYYAHVAQMLCETDSNAIRGEIKQPFHISMGIVNYKNSNLNSISPVIAPGYVKSLWEEGTAYFGWFFYMSKFYEVLDTMIILASGKKSSTLQTYHHAGIMFCTWASLKYASPTYLVGIVLNSGVHTLMVCDFRVLFLKMLLMNCCLTSSTLTLQSSHSDSPFL